MMPITLSLPPTAVAKKALGFTLIELIVTVSIVAILATAALDRLFWYQGQAEKANMDYTANMIKSGLWMSAASLMMANKSAEIPALAKQNPINLLAQKPENYLGEIDSSQIKSLKLKEGNWFFKPSENQMIYIVKHRHNFIPATADDYTVKYEMKLLYAEMEVTAGHKVSYIAGVTLVPLSRYVWQ